MISCATAFMLLSAVLCQLIDDEEYANADCPYQWGGIVCDCEYSKYVNFPLPYVRKFFIHFFPSGAIFS